MFTRQGGRRFDTSLGDDVTDALRAISQAAGQVESVAGAAAGGGYQTASFVVRYKVPIAAAAGLAAGILLWPAVRRSMRKR